MPNTTSIPLQKIRRESNLASKYGRKFKCSKHHINSPFRNFKSIQVYQNRESTGNQKRVITYVTDHFKQKIRPFLHRRHHTTTYVGKAGVSHLSNTRRRQARQGNKKVELSVFPNRVGRVSSRFFSCRNGFRSFKTQSSPIFRGKMASFGLPTEFSRRRRRRRRRFRKVLSSYPVSPRFSTQNATLSFPFDFARLVNRREPGSVKYVC